MSHLSSQLTEITPENSCPYDGQRTSLRIIHIQCSKIVRKRNGEGGPVESYSWSPSHDHFGILRPAGTSAADRW